MALAIWKPVVKMGPNDIMKLAIPLFCFVIYLFVSFF
jgi:hypothetical protein